MGYDLGDMFKVLETARRVSEKSRQVRIDHQALIRFSSSMLEAGIEVPQWDHRYHFYDGGEETVSYLLVLDSLNFCFWAEQGKRKWEIEYGSKRLSGYYALAASLKKAVESGVPITRPEYLAGLSLEELKDILGGRGELQLMQERRRILNELGRVILRNFQGGAYKLVEGAGYSAIQLARLLADSLSSFRDMAEYRGSEVCFLKRAQIFAADLYGSFGGEGWGCLRDMNKLTAFADYKVPQVLRHSGILIYDQSLSQKVDQEIHIESGSPEEVEIRANTIWAVELIGQELDRMGKGLRAFEVDWVLWNLGRNTEYKVRPYHRTVTVYY